MSVKKRTRALEPELATASAEHLPNEPRGQRT
jgi:hypothetical protein